MKKNILLLCSTLSLLLPAASVDTPSIESLEDTIQKNPGIRAYIKDILHIPEQNAIMKNISSPEKDNSKLNFEELTKKIFDDHYWLPHPYSFSDTQLNNLFSDYYAKINDLDYHNIFLANILYEAGSKFYQQKKIPDYLEYAAALGHSGAQYKMYFIKFKENALNEAKNYILSSAAQKHSDALLTLSKVYAGVWKIGLPKDMAIAKSLCKEAANQGNPEAVFRLEVATLTGGMFNSSIDYQAGILKAKELCEKGNPRATDFINAIMNSSGDALMEGNENITYDDLDFLKKELGWEDEGEEN
ncbi:MAG: hypothetical protein K0M45_11530 [Candidatus Paracaedibacteraceae bacterium]|nr:hypothetical protein [Candidatus Paracaedibacteraceae bacterium]